jgi:hypothetical protein
VADQEQPVAQVQPASAGFAGQPVQSDAVPAGAAQVDPADRLDETVEGGRYRVGGVWVNSEGVPLKDQKGK